MPTMDPSQRTREILEKYSYSDYLVIPETFQRLTEATVLHCLLSVAPDLSAQVNVPYLCDYLEKNEDDRRVFLKCWEDGNFDAIFHLDGIASLLRPRDSAGTQIIIHGGSFKEIHGDNYELEITLGEDDQPIMNWLCQVDHISVQRDIYRRRTNDTGNWFIRHPDFESWVSKKENSLLWCPGIPGAGKTVISSVVINHLQTQDSLVVFVYFDYKRQKDQTNTFVLGSLARQLYYHVPSSRAAFKALYEKQKHEHPTERQLMDVLGEVIQGLEPHLFCVLDALDEYLESYRDETAFHLVDSIASLADDTIKLMVTSRILGGMESLFKERKALRLEIVGAIEDIQSYVQHRVSEDIPFAKKLIGDIASAVLAVSQHRFLQARLHMDHLCSLLNTGEVRDALPNLSASINDSYNLVLERIDGQSQSRKRLAYRALSWVAQSFIPLTERRLQEALATERGRTAFDDYIVCGDVITAVCAGLIVIEDESRIVKFIHMTAFEYFLNNPSQLQFKSPFLAGTCMDHILAKVEQYSNGWNRRTMRETFLGYALFYWGFHCMNIEEEILEDILKFICTDERTLPAITGPILQYPSRLDSDRIYPEDFLDDDPMDVGTPLHVAAYFRLPCTLAFFLMKGISVNEPAKMSKMTPLAFIAAYGHISMAEILLYERGIDKNRKNVKGFSPLALAAYTGDIEIVELLLQQADIDVKSQNDLGDTPLLLASVRGHTGIVHKLLKVDTHSDDVHIAVAWAIRNGHESAVDLLLSVGGEPTRADVWTTGWMLPNNPSTDNTAILSRVFAQYPHVATHCMVHSEALPFLAACWGHENILKLLFKLGLASPDEKDQNGCSVLSHALGGRYLGVANTVFNAMMSHNGDVYTESRDNKGRTDLSYAAERGFISFVEIFLQMGDIEPSQLDNGGRSPLSYAAGCRNPLDGVYTGDALATVTRLFEYGANLDDMDGQGRTPLSYAAEASNTAVVQMLLKNGADPRKVDNTNRSPLSYAVKPWSANGVIAKLLLHHDHPPDANRPDAEGRTPLSYAAEAGYPENLRLLLEHGASIDSVDIRGRTPLVYAAKGFSMPLVEDRNSECVKILLEKGSAVDHLCVEGRTPLSYAARLGHHMSSTVLLDHGGMVDSVDKKGRTPLSYAFEAMRKDTWFSLETINALLARGANPYICDVEGKTPLNYGGLSASDLVVVKKGPDESI